MKHIELGYLDLRKESYINTWLGWAIHGKKVGHNLYYLEFYCEL